MNEFWLHPITGYPATRSVKKTLKIAQMAGYSKLIVAPLSFFSIAQLVSLEPQHVGSIEGAWHHLTKSSFFHPDGIARVRGKLNDGQAALPWDNMFWGDAMGVIAKEKVIQKRFPNALYSGHFPTNTIEWPGPYTWEINPDHGICAEEIFDLDVDFSVDMLHLLRPARKHPHNPLVSEEGLIPFLTRLVRIRGQSIKSIHLHLSASQVIPFALGIVPEQTKEGFRILAHAPTNPPVSVQFMPPIPFNMLGATVTSFLLKRIRLTSETLMFEARKAQLSPVFAM